MDLAGQYKTYTLVENHRSKAEIVRASSKLILNNKLRIEGENRPTRGLDEKCINVHHRDDMYKTVAEILGSYSGEIAILCRTNREIDEMILELGSVGLEKSLPVSVLRSNPLFIMLISLIRLRTERCKPHWMLFLRDNARLDGFDFEFNKYSFSEPISYFEQMAPDWVVELLMVEDFNEFLSKFMGRLESSLFDTHVTLARKLVTAFRADSFEGTEVAFLAWFATMNVQDILPEEMSGVRVMTIHQSKGLEFDNVVMIMPKYKPRDEESRRIVFVGSTRAINMLDLIAYPDNGYLKEMGL